MSEIGLGNDINEIIVKYYVRNNYDRYYLSEIIKVIILFCGNIILFSVYNGNDGFNIINKCSRIYINGDALYFVNDDGMLYVYGSNNKGQLGLTFCSNNIVSTTEHPYLKGNIKLISKSIAANHCFIRMDHKLYAYGANIYKQTGINNATILLSKTIVPYLFDSTLKDIKCGGHHSLFLTENGNVYGCGNNDFNQLTSKYNKYNSNTIQCIIHSNDIKFIDCCYHSSFALDMNNKLKYFGHNYCNQLGRYGESIECSQINNDIKSFSCGDGFFGYITIKNELYMYGNNDTYQCGLNNNNICYYGNKIKINNIKSVKCGGFHTILRTKNNKYYSFGCNKSNKLLIKTNQIKVFIPQLISYKYIYDITKSFSFIYNILPSYNNTYILQTLWFLLNIL